jgi:hypothetical protein
MLHVVQLFFFIAAYLLIVLVKLVYLVPATCAYALLRLGRWVVRGSNLALATSWPAADAVVDASFELDESSRRIRNLLANLLVGSLYEGPRIHLSGRDKMVDIYDDDSGNDNSKPWISGFRYSYSVGDMSYGGTFLLPGAYENSGLASGAGADWIGKDIRVRYNPNHPEKSFFLVEDGAPGKPRIPAGWASEPYLISLSLRPRSSRKANG